MTTTISVLIAFEFFNPGLALAEPLAIGCSQYGRHEMGYGLTILMIVLLIGQRRRDGSELPTSPVS